MGNQRVSELKDLVTKLTSKYLQLALNETEREQVKKYINHFSKLRLEITQIIKAYRLWLLPSVHKEIYKKVAIW